MYSLFAMNSIEDTTPTLSSARWIEGTKQTQKINAAQQVHEVSGV